MATNFLNSSIAKSAQLNFVLDPWFITGRPLTEMDV